MLTRNSAAPTTNSAALTSDTRMTRLAPLALILVLLIVGALLSASAWWWLKPLETSASAIPQGNSNNSHQRTLTVRFTLYDVGILPREVHIPRGRVAISIVDRSGGSSGVIVERLDGPQRVAAGQVARAEGKQRGLQAMHLQPGTYLVTMADRPDNSATLIVDP